MNRTAQPLTEGARFDRLVAVEFHHRDEHSEAFWLFRCDCGNTCVVRARGVTSGKTRSCGCYRRELARAACAGPDAPRKPHALRVGYRAALNRIQASRGRAVDHACHFCNRPAQWWVYDRSDPMPLTETRTRRGRTFTFSYSLDPARYLPMCSACRRRVGLLVQRRADHSRAE